MDGKIVRCFIPGRTSFAGGFTFGEKSTKGVEEQRRVLPVGLDTSEAVQLTGSDYSDYLAFFQSVHPSSNPEGWLAEYFACLADRGLSWGLSWGVYRDGRLASATDAPDVPFMKDVVVEMGINTLPEYPRQGLAKTVTGALIKYLLERGRVPLWSCSSDKFASQGLAASLGFVRFADVIAVTLD